MPASKDSKLGSKDRGFHRPRHSPPAHSLPTAPLLWVAAYRQPSLSGSQPTDSPHSLGHSLQTALPLWVTAYRQPSLSGSQPTDSPHSLGHSLQTALPLWVTAYRQPSLSGSQPTDSPPAYSLQTALVTTCLLWLLERETSLSICFCTTHTSAAKAGVLMHCYQ